MAWARLKTGARCGATLAMALLFTAGTTHLHAQASAIESAQIARDDANGSRGRKLLDQMVVALGGDAWQKRTQWVEYGKGSTFYKGAPNPYVFEFEDYFRAAPYGERRVIVSKNANPITELIGVPMSKAKRDIQTVWTNENGYEITYAGKKALPKEDVSDYERRRAHTIDVLVNDWLKRPGTLVTFEGNKMYGRRIADTISVLTADNDSMTVRLDADTHLPISRTFQWRDPVYKDFNTEEDQYDNYQPQGGVQTPLTITRLHNGDIVAQRYLTKVVYNTQLSPDLFDPDRPLQKK